MEVHSHPLVLDLLGIEEPIDAQMRARKEFIREQPRMSHEVIEVIDLMAERETLTLED